MAKQEATCVWQGKSGKQYTYWIYKIGTNFSSVPANYIFSKRNSEGKWSSVYIGETSDVSERFDNHHAKGCVVRNGATHIHVHKSSSSKQERLNEETDLRRRYNPPCNKQ